MSHSNTRLTVQTCTPKCVSITNLSKTSSKFHFKTFSNPNASFYTVIKIFSPTKWPELTSPSAQNTQIHDFLFLKKKKWPQSRIKTGITLNIKLHLYFRIPFEIYIHWKVYVIFATCLVLSRCTCALLSATYLSFLFKQNFILAFWLPLW